jgi:hypothetical protein
MVIRNISASCRTIKAESAHISAFFAISIFAETALAIDSAITLPITIDHKVLAKAIWS